MSNIINKILYITFLLSLFILPASAAFSDNFNDCSITDWTLVGSWTTTNISKFGLAADCAASKTSAVAPTNQYMNHSVSGLNNYFSFDFKHHFAGGFVGAFTNINYEANTTTSNYFSLSNTYVLSSNLPGYVSQATNDNQWYRLTITKSGTNLIINLYNQTLTLINTQTIPNRVINTPSYFSLQQVSYNLVGSTDMLDNLVISETAPSSITTTHIEFDATEYFNHDLMTITWGQTDTDWTDIFYFKTIVLDWSDETGASHETQLLASPPQSGTYVFQIYQIGTYEVKLQKSFLGLGSPILLASDTAMVRSEAQSYIYTDSPTAFMRVPFNVHYSIGYSLSGYTSEIEIIGTNAVTGGIIEVSIIDASLGNTGTQIMQQTDVKVWPEGQYTLKLYDARKDQVLDTKFITIVNDPRLIPVLLFNASNISTDRAAYFINDYMTVDFTVDDANFTNYTIRADVYNFNTSTTTKQFFTAFTGQTGSFETLVNSKINMQCDRGVYCWFEPGDNQIQLVRYNDTFASVISFYNFSVASTTVDGWGLSLSSQNISTTETLTMRAIVPAGQTGKLQIRDPGFSPNATKIYVVDNINEGTQTYKTTITRVGTSGKGYYEVEIIDQSNNVVKMHLPITVTKTGAVVVDGAIQTGTDLTGLLSSKIFWALLFIIGIMLAIAVKERGK